MAGLTAEQLAMFGRYDEAMAAGDLATAFSIAYAHRDDFDWEGEYPEDWTPEQIEQHRGEG